MRSTAVFVDRIGQPPREDGAVAGQIALPVLVARLGAHPAPKGRSPCRPAPVPARPAWRRYPAPACPTMRAADAAILFRRRQQGLHFPRLAAAGCGLLGRLARGQLARQALEAFGFRFGRAASSARPDRAAVQLAGRAGMQGGHGARRQVQNLFGFARHHLAHPAGLFLRQARQADQMLFHIAGGFGQADCGSCRLRRSSRRRRAAAARIPPSPRPPAGARHAWPGRRFPRSGSGRRCLRLSGPPTSVASTALAASLVSFSRSASRAKALVSCAARRRRHWP